MNDQKTSTPALDALYQRHSSKWRRFPSDVIPMHVAEMDFEISQPVRELIGRMALESDLGYLGPVPEVGDAFVEFASARWNWSVDASQLKLATDVGVATVEYLRAHLKPGDRVIINSPVYSGFFEWLKELDIEPLDVPLAKTDKGWRLDLPEIERAFAAGHLTLLLCNPHNPVGRAFDRDELTELAALAAKHGATVISDEIHAPLTFGDFVPYLTCGENAEATGVVITSASKSWNLAGLKAAFLVTQGDEMAKKVAKLPPALHWRTSILGAFAMAEAYRAGVQWLDTTVTTLESNRHHLKRELERLLPDVGYEIPEAGYLAWLDLSGTNLSTERILNEAKVSLVPGPDMGGSAYTQFARLNFATSEQIITQGIERIAAVNK
ncbi:MAG: MalY/PatB family protein [Microbacteriaceae bacterium]